MPYEPFIEPGAPIIPQPSKEQFRYNAEYLRDLRLYAERHAREVGEACKVPPEQIDQILRITTDDH